MIPFTATRIAPLALILALGACAGGDKTRYPSLQMRDVERISGKAEAVQPNAAPEIPVQPSADLSQRLSQLVGRAQQAHRGFVNDIPATRQAVAGSEGAEVASEGWSVAQASLSSLDAARNPAIIALADLDVLYVQSELEVGAADAVAAARDEVQALVSEEDSMIGELSSRLSD